MEMQLARIAEREEKLQAARAKKEADLALLDDEQDDFKVKISLADYELLQAAKRQDGRAEGGMAGGGQHMLMQPNAHGQAL